MSGLSKDDQIIIDSEPAGLVELAGDDEGDVRTRPWEGEHQRRGSWSDAGRLISEPHHQPGPALFDAVLADASIKVILSGVRIPRMNSIMKRWIRNCHREVLDRTLIWNQQPLLHALRQYEQFYNAHCRHQPPATTHLDIRQRQRLGGILNEYHHAA